MVDRFRKVRAHRSTESHSPRRHAASVIEAALGAETKNDDNSNTPLTGLCASILSTITETELAGG